MDYNEIDSTKTAFDQSPWALDTNCVNVDGTDGDGAICMERLGKFVIFIFVL